VGNPGCLSLSLPPPPFLSLFAHEKQPLTRVRAPSQIWLIEVNTNPYIGCSSQILREVTTFPTTCPLLSQVLSISLHWNSTRFFEAVSRLPVTWYFATTSFTICLRISPHLDGYRVPKTRRLRALASSRRVASRRSSPACSRAAPRSASIQTFPRRRAQTGPMSRKSSTATCGTRFTQTECLV
jgi:hypothetical protein